MNIQVIESVEKDGTEWGISFTDNNPDPKDYFKMPDKETAFRLKEKLSLPNTPGTGKKLIGASWCNTCNDYADKTCLTKHPESVDQSRVASTEENGEDGLANQILTQIYKHLDSLPYAGGYPSDWHETLAKHLASWQPSQPNKDEGKQEEHIFKLIKFVKNLGYMNGTKMQSFFTEKEIYDSFLNQLKTP